MLADECQCQLYPTDKRNENVLKNGGFKINISTYFLYKNFRGRNGCMKIVTGHLLLSRNPKEKESHAICSSKDD